MHIKEHNDQLKERIHLLDKDSDLRLAFELFELHEEKCTICQEDRLGCTVRPSCRNRNFLNMLIEIGVEPQDLPSFCYSQHLDQIRRYILEKQGRGMIDRRLPIKDMLSALRMSSIRQFTARFSKIWSKSARVREGDLFLIMGDDLIFHFDFARGIALLNPLNYALSNFQVFKMYCTLFRIYYELSIQVEALTENWWELTVKIPGAKKSEIMKAFTDEMLEHFEALDIEKMETALEIHLEAIADETDELVSVGDLLEVFKVLAANVSDEKDD